MDFAGICLDGKINLGDLLVAIGTLLLAFFTYRLATRTSRVAALTERGLALSRESIEALDRPFIIASPDEQHQLLGFSNQLGPEHEGWRFVYRLWNLGKGPAIVEQMSLVDPDSSREYLDESEKMERSVAMNPPVHDGLTKLRNGTPGAGANLLLKITYRSASGSRYATVSRLLVTDNLSCICTDFQRTALGPE